MGIESILVWPGRSDAEYREAKRQVFVRSGSVPRTLREISFSDFFDAKNNASVYFPVFQGTTGWWGELLGTGAKVRGKMIISPECQVYEISKAPGDNPNGTRQLFAAEIAATPGFIKRLKDGSVAVKDMIATESGNVLALLTGAGESRVRRSVASAGGEYLGHLGGY
ncbi:MAG: hypothetical protein LBL46_02715 [Rickettsiales bacterium]|jgi:hypothetical protein|nr:hypothetical protein [Rickettsiales bacterium]